MARKKTAAAAEETPTPKKRASRKKDEGVETEAASEIEVAGDVEVDAEPVKAPEAVPARKAEPAARATIADLIAPVTLALLERHARLPSAGAVTTAFAAHYEAARARFEKDAATVFGDAAHVAPLPELPTAAPLVTPTFEALPPEPAPWEDADTLPAAPPADDPFGDTADAADDDASEATIHFDPSALVAQIDADDAPAEVPPADVQADDEVVSEATTMISVVADEEEPVSESTVMISAVAGDEEPASESTVMISAVDDEPAGAEGDESPAAAATPASGHKGRKSKRKR